ncbi:MAG TPA: acyltransferase [Bryobacteraceae bacterium]|nr:acyltransferase [Bryobacteraceae bacterium]
MNREFSLYLDLVRFSAAVLVVMSHANVRALSERIIPYSNLGHSAVIIFFVLSGFVIAYVTDAKEKSALEYTASRMARIYSVALPALVLTILADSIGEHLNPALYVGETTHDWSLLRVASSVLFMNEFWGISITAFSNVPYWSLCYEVWYYVLFGMFIFWRGPGRGVVLILCMLLAGPKILLLLPIWLLGVHLWRSKWGERLGVGQGLTLYVLSWILLIIFVRLDIETRLADFLREHVGATVYTNMTFSRWFLSDYLLGIVVYLNFAGYWAASPALGKCLRPVAKFIRWAAGLTLSIYLFHRPLLLFYIALLHGDPKGYSYYFEVLGLVLLTVVVLAQFTEHRKDRYRRVFAQALTWFAARIKQRFPRLFPG